MRLSTVESPRCTRHLRAFGGWVPEVQKWHEAAGMDGTPGARTSSSTFEDGFGKRYELTPPDGKTVSVLALGSALLPVPEFLPTLTEQITRFARLRHPGIARVLRMARVANGDRGVAVLSEHVGGERLAKLLAASRQHGVRLDTNGTFWIVGQLVSAIAALHDLAPGAFHGAIAAERLIVTPDARVVVADHVLGPSVERLRWTREQYWRTLRVTLPSNEVAFSQATDVAQIGILAIALLEGRPVSDAATAGAALQGLPPALRSWILRAVQADPNNRFLTASEAQAGLNQILSDADHVAGCAGVSDLYSAYCDLRRPPDTRMAVPRQETTAPAKEPQVAPEPVTTALNATLAAETEPVAKPSAVPVAMEPAPRVAAELAQALTPDVPPVTAMPPERAETPGALVAREVVTPADGIEDDSIPPRDFIPGVLRGLTWAPWKMAAAAAGLMLLATATTYAARQYLRTSVESVAARPGAAVEQPPTTPVEPIEITSLSEPTPAGPDPLQALLAPAAPAPEISTGWIAVRAPQEVEVRENGRVLGTSQGGRIQLAAGRHQLELVNESLGLRVTRDVTVYAGRGANVTVPWPDGTLALNALPWADVWIDGQRVGETPLANLTIPIGSHEVIFRHPELGERREFVTVTTTPQRLSVDLRGPQP